MIRILHFADLHLGVETYGRPDPDTGLSTRLLDFLRAFDELVDFAIGEQVDVVLFCGDAYKSPQPTQTHQREFARRIRRLVDADIPILLLVGNHDLPAAVRRATTLEIFDTLAIEHVHVAAKPTTLVIPTRNGPLQIVALPWVTPSRFLSREEYRNMAVHQLLREMENRMDQFIQEQADKLSPDAPGILAAHVAMRAPFAKKGSEQWMTLGSYPEVLKSTLHFHDFDYAALGHHHVRQQIGIETPIVYPGSFQRLDFGEEKDDKGFYLLTIDPGRPRGQRVVGEPEFHAVWARPFVTVDVRPRQEDPTPEVLAAIERAPVGDAIVRVVIRVSRQQQALLRQAEVRQALAEAHFLAYVKAELTEEARSGRLPPHVRPESLTPMDALRLYFDDRKLPPDRREVLLRYARSLVAGEEEEEVAAAAGSG
jgi:exonuclease SbcD